MTFISRTPQHSQLAQRRGMTLVELLISMMVLGLMSVVLAGMSNAVNSAWEYTKGVGGTEQQASAVIDRIKYMVGQTGTYRVAGQPTRLGMAVVEREVSSTTVPDVLVLWTGGRDGGMAALGQQTRLPIASELLAYTWNEKSPSQLVEVAFPGDSTTVDFASSDFAASVATLLASPTVERIPLCERLRIGAIGQTSSSLLVPTSSGGLVPALDYGQMLDSTASTITPQESASAITIGNVRFAIAWAPTSTELASVAPQSAGWMQLSWPQGAVGSQTGMRQATLSLEVQIEPDGVAATNGEVSAIPFFGSASVRYVYQP